jgi:hypothetical protein
MSHASRVDRRRRVYVDAILRHRVGDVHDARVCSAVCPVGDAWYRYAGRSAAVHDGARQAMVGVSLLGLVLAVITFRELYVFRAQVAPSPETESVNRELTALRGGVRLPVEGSVDSPTPWLIRYGMKHP